MRRGGGGAAQYVAVSRQVCSVGRSSSNANQHVRKRSIFFPRVHPGNGLKESWQPEEVDDMRGPLCYWTTLFNSRNQLWKISWCYRVSHIEMGWRKVDNRRKLTICAALSATEPPCLTLEISSEKFLDVTGCLILKWALRILSWVRFVRFLGESTTP